ncbi:MAG: hypothetical protein ACM3PS_02525 [Syntrophothermus sp.]
MSRTTKILLLSLSILFVLACSTITQPFNQAKDLAGTAQALATAMPVQTFQSLATQFATQVPVETLQALPSMAPSLEALGTSMPNFEGFFNPQGTPVSEWNGLPVMPQATAGQEFKESHTYSYKVDASVKEAQDYYNTELVKLGWKSSFNMPGNDSVAVQMFQKDSSILTVTITEVNGSVVVVLSLA